MACYCKVCDERRSLDEWADLSDQRYYQSKLLQEWQQWRRRVGLEPTTPQRHLFEKIRRLLAVLIGAEVEGQS